MINHLDIKDIYRTTHRTTPQCALFSNAGGTHTKTDYMVNRKASLSTFQKTEMIWNSASQTSTRININQDLEKM